MEKDKILSVRITDDEYIELEKMQKEIKKQFEIELTISQIVRSILQKEFKKNKE